MVEASDWLHCPFDSSTLPSEKTVRMRQQGKAAGCVSPTALLFTGPSALTVQLMLLKSFGQQPTTQE
jgi:hypothetical protein